ncbi:ribonuclease H family protein [Bacillus mesophilum]|uniref:Reverse transcriptase-like protein n=1 Tax=Bacillus mesophilum TaxID=1071718 RepID=A0A7V7UVY6_9BACI|nr:ribonuclease H family protein [Bacillus mesophilum]KAB2333611.1 reverse transcriptase-like protein [Bacillus mesophilum]
MKYKLEWNYKLKGSSNVFFTSDWLTGELALLTGEELAKSGRALDMVYYDERGTSWTLKELGKLLEEIEEEPHDIVVYFDGGYDKQEQLAGLGAVIYYKQGKKKYRLRANELLHEIDDNNEAEYAAFYFCVNMLEEMGVRHMSCEFKGDSQVVLNQLAGEWPCYEENLNRWLDRIEAKIKKLGLIPAYSPVGRNENKEADKLATQAIEGKNIHSKMQMT